MAQVWFTSSNNNDGLNSHTNDSNIFQGNPVWNISSWHEDKTSIPQPYAIHLDELYFKDSQIEWPLLSEGDDGTNSDSRGIDSKSSLAVELTFNLKILLGSSSSSQVDKFKLLGIVTC